MGRKIVLFDAFTGGEYGNLSEVNAPKNSFTASNMLVYSTGEIGVRPGLFKSNPSGLANGVVQGFGQLEVPNSDIWFVQGTAVRSFSILGTNNLLTAASALASTPTLPVTYCVDANTAIIASSADKLYRISTSTTLGVQPTLAALTGSPGARAVTVYGDRIVAGYINGSSAYRLRYSDAANPNSWPSANFIDVGDSWGIHALFSQRQHLLIQKQVGAYVLTGVPGVNDVLRKVSTRTGPFSQYEAAIDTNDLVWLVENTLTYPSAFNGSVVREWPHLETFSTTTSTNGGLPPTYGVAPHRINGGSGALFLGPSNKLALYDGQWTFHSLGVTAQYVASRGPFGGSYFYFCDGGAAGAPPNFYIWRLDNDSPGLESASYMRAGDDSSTALTGTLSLPEWWATDGAEVRVRAVVVDFRSWNTGSATTNHFDLVVNARRRYQAGTAQASNTVSFDEAAASSSTSGTLQRRVFGLGEQGPGNGFQLAFTNVRGVAIRRIEVILDSEPLRI